MALSSGAAGTASSSAVASWSTFDMMALTAKDAVGTVYAIFSSKASKHCDPAGERWKDTGLSSDRSSPGSGATLQATVSQDSDRASAGSQTSRASLMRQRSDKAITRSPISFSDRMLRLSTSATTERRGNLSRQTCTHLSRTKSAVLPGSTAVLEECATGFRRDEAIASFAIGVPTRDASEAVGQSFYENQEESDSSDESDILLLSEAGDCHVEHIVRAVPARASDKSSILPETSTMLSWARNRPVAHIDRILPAGASDQISIHPESKTMQPEARDCLDESIDRAVPARDSHHYNVHPESATTQWEARDCLDKSIDRAVSAKDSHQISIPPESPAMHSEAKDYLNESTGKATPARESHHSNIRPESLAVLYPKPRRRNFFPDDSGDEVDGSEIKRLPCTPKSDSYLVPEVLEKNRLRLQIMERDPQMKGKSISVVSSAASSRQSRILFDAQELEISHHRPETEKEQTYLKSADETEAVPSNGSARGPDAACKQVEGSSLPKIRGIVVAKRNAQKGTSFTRPQKSPSPENHLWENKEGALTRETQNLRGAQAIAIVSTRKSQRNEIERRSSGAAFSSSCLHASNLCSRRFGSALPLSRKPTAKPSMSRSLSQSAKPSLSITEVLKSSFSRDLDPLERRRRSTSPETCKQKVSNVASRVASNANRNHAALYKSLAPLSPATSKMQVEAAKIKTVLDPYGARGTFSGILIRGRPHGYGTMQYVDGRTYIGEWKYGRWQGAGRVTFKNGDIYVGDFDMDQRHGFGRYAWADGRVYDGEFYRDRREGSGTYLWPDGSSYVGKFSAGQRHGKGVYSFLNGSTYSGEWKNGRYHGVGECRWNDGRCYQGEWRQGHATGYGVETRKNGTIRYAGYWEEDSPLWKLASKIAPS